MTPPDQRRQLDDQGRVILDEPQPNQPIDYAAAAKRGKALCQAALANKRTQTNTETEPE